MFDNIINAIKGYFPDRFIQYVVSAAVAMLLFQLLQGTGINAISLLHFVVSIAAAGLLAFAVAGAAKS